MPLDTAPNRRGKIASVKAYLPSDAHLAIKREGSSGGNPSCHKNKSTRLNKIREHLGQAKAMLGGRKNCQKAELCEDIEYLLGLLKKSSKVNEGQYHAKKGEGA